MFSKFVHIVIAFNLLVSTTGITVYEHLCSKNGSSFALFQKPKSCCSKKKSGTCSVSGCKKPKQIQDTTIKSKPCCEDKSHYDKLNFSATSHDQSIYSEISPLIYSPIHWAFTGLNEADAVNGKILKFYLYKPPPLLKDDIRILHMSFLC